MSSGDELCPLCGSVAKEDTGDATWPPKEDDGSLQVPFVCSLGHQFVRKIPLKTK